MMYTVPIYMCAHEMLILTYTCTEVTNLSMSTIYTTPGADPEMLHGKWLMGWLPVVNYTGARGVDD